MRSIVGIFLALALVTAADAQQRKANLANDEVMEARRACFAEAKVRVPGPAEHSPGLQPCGRTHTGIALSGRGFGPDVGARQSHEKRKGGRSHR